MGYRFVLISGKYTNEPGAGDAFEMDLTFKNMGWASPVNPRDVEVIFISKANSAEKYKVAVDTDPRLWYPQEEKEVANKTFITAAPFRIHTLSLTGKKLIATTFRSISLDSTLDIFYFAFGCCCVIQ